MPVLHLPAELRCPNCSSAELTPWADLGMAPVYQNARYHDPAAARSVVQGRLLLAACRACGFAFNAGFDPDLATYDVLYVNDQTASDHFSAHVIEVAAKAWSLVATLPAPTVLEVGCGKGGFLNSLASIGQLGLAIGFDPSLPQAVSRPRLRLENSAFTAAAAETIVPKADLAVLRHVIEHVFAPIELLRSTLHALAPGRGTILIETPCFDWILKHDAWHDVFYEHCNYFTADSLAFLMRQAGFTDVAVEYVFEGQYLLATGTAGAGRAADPTPARGAGLADHAKAFGRGLQPYTDHWRLRLAGGGPIAVWGAGAKGVTFSGLLAGSVDLRCLIDIDPKKQGTFAARTGLPIVAPESLREYGIRTVVVMNPNYAGEIRRLLEAMAEPIEVVVLDG